MIDWTGIQTDGLQIDIGKFVGILLFEEFPSTFVYSGVDENPVIKEWVDGDKEGTIDRFFYYKTSKYLLKEFIESKISHQDLINKALDGMLYFQDIKDNMEIHYFVSTPNKLPFQYKPSPNFFIKEEDLVDIREIELFFKLNEYSLKEESAASQTKIIAIDSKSETFNVHIAQGDGVGNGTIEPSILGWTLVGIDRFYENIALDSLKGKERGAVKKGSVKEKLSNVYSMEVYLQKAASYEILLRPKEGNFQISNQEKSFRGFIKKSFDLIQVGDNMELLKSEYGNHSNFTIKSFKFFLETVYELKLNIDLGWFNPANKEEMNQNIDFKKANHIINNLNKIEVLSKEEFKVTGKFREINLNSGHFTFESTDQSEFKGYFSKERMEASKEINFIAVYDIVISRENIKEADKKEIRTKDIIIGVYLS